VKKIVQKFQWNDKLGRWEIITTDSDFVQMDVNSLAALYRMEPNFRRQVVKTAETLREALIEEAVSRSDFSEAKEVIEWVKNGRQES
jgi:hypothetical protein